MWPFIDQNPYVVFQEQAGSYDQPPLQPTEMEPNNSFRVDSEFRYTLFPIFYSIVFVLGSLPTATCCGSLPACTLPRNSTSPRSSWWTSPWLTCSSWSPCPVDHLLLQPGRLDSSQIPVQPWLAASSSLTPTAQWPSWPSSLTTASRQWQGPSRPLRLPPIAWLPSVPDYLGVHCGRSILLRPGLDQQGAQKDRLGQHHTLLWTLHGKGSIPVPHHPHLPGVQLLPRLPHHPVLQPGHHPHAAHAAGADAAMRGQAPGTLDGLHRPGCVHHLFRAPPPRAAALDPGRAGLQDTDFHQGINGVRTRSLSASLVPFVLDPIIYCFLTKFRKHLTRSCTVCESRKCSRPTGDGHECSCSSKGTYPNAAQILV